MSPLSEQRGTCDLCDAQNVPIVNAADDELEVFVTYCRPCYGAVQREWEAMAPEDKAAVEADIQAERDYLRGRP